MPRDQTSFVDLRSLYALSRSSPVPKVAGQTYHTKAAPLQPTAAPTIAVVAVMKVGSTCGCGMSALRPVSTPHVQKIVEPRASMDRLNPSVRSAAEKVMPVTWTLYDNYPRTPQLQRLSTVDLKTELEVPLMAGATNLLLWGATSPSQRGLSPADLQTYVNQELSPLVHEICNKYGCTGDM